MEVRPLPDDLAVRPRIVHLIQRDDAGEMVRGDVTNAIAARLDGMHLDRGKLLEDVRNGLERRPVELQVLTSREVPKAAVEFLADRT